MRVFRDDGEIATDYPMSNFVGLNAAVYDDDGDYEVQHPEGSHTFLIWQPPSSLGNHLPYLAGLRDPECESEGLER